NQSKKDSIPKFHQGNLVKLEMCNAILGVANALSLRHFAAPGMRGCISACVFYPDQEAGQSVLGVTTCRVAYRHM
ncbi:MAG: hypothetical protein NTX56_19595, partial [Proteobacteria bacterium]|nr:hypothetical protein [Pseudomonadota bacterium]